MTFPMFRCTEEFAQKIPSFFVEQEIVVSTKATPNSPYAYKFQRGLGKVNFSILHEESAQHYLFSVACGSNPLFWFFDMRLLKRVENILLSHGAQVWNPPDSKR